MQPPTPEALRQLTYLRMALSPGEQHTTMNYHLRREQWATNLLRRYLLASGSLSGDSVPLVNRAKIDDLRTIVSTVLEVFRCEIRYRNVGDQFVQSFHRDTPVPADFDIDVFPSLGWNYGLLFAKAVQRYASQDRLSKALARQWVREGTMWE
jgi:hypothetical protein